MVVGYMSTKDFIKLVGVFQCEIGVPSVTGIITCVKWVVEV